MSDNDDDDDDDEDGDDDDDDSDDSGGGGGGSAGYGGGEVNKLGYGLEVLVHISLPDLHKIAEELVLPDDMRLRIIEEGRPPVCYACGINQMSPETRTGGGRGGEKERQRKIRMKKEKNEESTEEQRQRLEPSTSMEEERRKKRLVSEKDEQTETEILATEVESEVIQPRRPLKGIYERVMVCYRKRVEIERRISKMKSIIRIKLAKKEENRNKKAVVLEDDTARRLREIFGDRIEK
uniref:Uncharacterized protein n=1 Tax=Octopus bimaculoides TaxID=37653 RepID=A0A0L8H7Q8_OCTBM